MGQSSFINNYKHKPIEIKSGPDNLYLEHEITGLKWLVLKKQAVVKTEIAD